MTAASRVRCRGAFALLLLGLCAGCARDASSGALADIGKRWVQAWNQRDPEQLLSLFDADATFWSPGMKAPLRGKPAVRKHLEMLWANWPEMERHDNAIFVEEATGKVAIDWSMVFRGVRNGRPVQVFGMDVLHVQHGIITVDRSVFDMCDIVAQINAPPDATPGATATAAPAATAPQP